MGMQGFSLGYNQGVFAGRHRVGKATPGGDVLPTPGAIFRLSHSPSTFWPTAPLAHFAQKRPEVLVVSEDVRVLPTPSPNRNK